MISAVPITPDWTAAAPAQALHAALALVSSGPVYRTGRRNGPPPCIADELLRRGYIEATTISRPAFGAVLAVEGYRITPAGRAALAAADAGKPQPSRKERR